MSSRRTRSGTPLGCSSESRRLRQTPSRKQHQQRAAEETNAADKESGAGKSEHGHRDGPEKKPVPPAPSRTGESTEKSASTLNIWERLETVRNDSHAAAKKCATKYSEDRVSCAESEAQKTSAEIAATDTPKKGRKPEILLSLLEGESITLNSVRKGEDSDKGKDEETVACSSVKIESSSTQDALDRKRSHDEKLSSFSQSICFFPNCDHVHEACADFSRIPEVPGESFFVSLSKDKNKELNMVKTSSGMVRVGCGLRQFLPSTHVFSESYARDSTFPSQDPMVTCHQDRGGGTSVCTLEAKVHVLRLDKSARLSKSKEKHDGDAVGSGEYDSRRAGSDEQCDWSPSGEHRDCLSDSDFSTDLASVHETKSLVPCKSSQHRTMEEILTDGQHATFSASATSGVSIHEMTTEEIKLSKKTISLLKPPSAAPHGALQSFPSATSMITTPSLSTILSSTASSLVTSSDGVCEKKGALKRSERIRCKSGASAVSVTQSVISTMKTSDSRSRLKSSMQRNKKKSKLTTSKENHKKKVSSGSKKSSFSKKSKDSSRSKVTMSREVMDAIVQSIEETVSRAREEKSSSSDQMSTSNSDYSSYNDMSSSFSDSSKESSYWSERAYDKSGDRSTDDASVASTSTGATLAHSSHKSLHLKSLKSKMVKKSSSKSKSSRRHSPGSCKWTKSSNSKKRDRPPDGERSPEVEQEQTQTLVATLEGDGRTEKANLTVDGDVGTSVALQGKRSRKKTRKAEEAFGDYDVFCEDDMPVKKSKSKRRSSSSDSTGSNSQRRPRRSSQIGGLMADPVLEEHAFILWASENRSQLEVQHPGASTCEVDAMLSSRWCDATDSVKSRFFFRAREAFSDDDRHMIRTSSMSELESCALGDYFSDNDAVLIEFIRLPIDRQRELLRKWLKFFQKMLPKKEYVEFIVTFKRACGRDSTSANGKPKRTRMKCLDPAHYKMLFDMIRLAKPRVLEIYREKKVKEKKMVSDTYSLMLHKLIGNDPWPHTVTGCRSELLSEILQDLDIPEQLDICVASPIQSNSSSNKNNNNQAQSPLLGLDTGVMAKVEESDVQPGRDTRVHITEVNKMPQILEFKLDHGGSDVGFEESDYSLLTTDLAFTLLSSVNELKELPHLDQQVLDQIFLAPPRLSVAPSPQRRAINLYGRRLDSLTAHLSPAVGGSICTPRFLASDSVAYPKRNVHYSATKISSPSPPNSSPSAMLVQHLRPPALSTSTVLPHKLVQQDSPTMSPVRGVCCRKESPMDMHSYSITMETMMQGGQKHVDTPLPKGIKLDPSVMPTQAKVSLQSLQLPMASRIHQKTKLYPRVVPVSCGFQQRFASQVYKCGSPNVLDKIIPHHLCHVAPTTLGTSHTAGSRPYPQSIGSLNAQSPLITSLSPLRNIKYTQAPYNPHCQMMPYRPRMQITAGTGGAGTRRSSHTIPLGTTMKSGVARGQSGGGLHQIKVCLPTQSLKLPIANLRGSRKAPYVRDKLKNFGLPTNTLEPYSSLTSCSQFNIRSGTPTSLLAKVLNLHVKNEYGESNGSSVDPLLLSRPSSSAFIGTMRPIGSQPTSSCHRSGSQVQLISVVTSTGHSGELRSALSPQTAVVVSPLSVNRNSLASSSSDLLSTSTTYTSHTPISSGQFFDLPSSIHSVTVQAKNSRPTVGKVISLESLAKTYERGFAPGVANKRAAGIEKEHASQPTSCLDDEAAVEFIVVGTCTTEVEGSASKSSSADNGCLEEGHSDQFIEGHMGVSATNSVKNNLVAKTGESYLNFLNQESDSVSGDKNDSESPNLYLRRQSPEASGANTVRTDASNQNAASAVPGNKGESTQYIIVQGPQHDLSTGTWRKLTVLEDSTACSHGTANNTGLNVESEIQGDTEVEKRAPIREEKGLVGSSPSLTKLNKDSVYDVHVVSEFCKGNNKSILGNKVVLRSSGPGPAAKDVHVTGRKNEGDDKMGKLGSRMKTTPVCSVTVKPDKTESSALRERSGVMARCPSSESVTTKTAGAHVSSATTLVTFTMTSGSAVKDRPSRVAPPQREGLENGAPVHEQITPAIGQSRNRAHYVHEYLPT